MVVRDVEENDMANFDWSVTDVWSPGAWSPGAWLAGAWAEGAWHLTPVPTFDFSNILDSQYLSAIGA